MHHVFRMKVDQSTQYLNSVLFTDCFAQTTVPFAEVSNGPSTHVFQIDAEHVVVCNLATVVRDDVFAV